MGGSRSCGSAHQKSTPMSHPERQDTPRSLDGTETNNWHIRKWGCKVYRHINKKTGRKKLDKKSMMGFLVGYESGNIYRIYHPATTEFKVSRDVIFAEKQFFGLRHVADE